MKTGQPEMRRIFVTSSFTLSVAVAVSARIGTPWNLLACEMCHLKRQLISHHETTKGHAAGKSQVQRRLQDLYLYIANLFVLRPEVMAPLAYTVCLQPQSAGIADKLACWRVSLRDQRRRSNF